VIAMQKNRTPSEEKSALRLIGGIDFNVVEFPGAEAAEIEWTQSMIDEVHGRAFRDLEKSICSRCSMSRTC
jgi:hypothetical protein